MRLFHSFLLAGCVAGVAAGGCADGMLGDTPDQGTNGENAGSNAGPGSTTNGAPVGDGVPCDVAQVLATNCTSCHSGAKPTAGLDLTTYASLTAPSNAVSSQTNIERSAIRMRDAQAPMPPTGAIADADIQIIEKWIADGTPQGTCGSGSTTPPPITVACTSNQFYTGSEGSSMRPGVACESCHTHQSGEKQIAFGGTVYPTAHEPDTCVGQNGATIVVTDANGAQHTATANANGNFHVMGAGLAFPIHAEIHANGKILKMNTAVDTGDCNSCHTVMGANNAPGRIVAPAP